MILEITRGKESLIKNKVYHFCLVDYPNISKWEWNNILAFICYEKANGKKLEIMCKDESILALVKEAANKLDGTEYIPPLAENVEEFVYHATDVSSAQKIFASGKLLSATKVYGKTGEEIELAKQGREWVDTADFYEYIMFGWGTHLVGDFVVLSENFPSEEELASGNYDAGVRFYIKYKDIIKHKGHTFDGYHAIKVKDEVVLSEYLFACIVPEQYKEQMEMYIPKDLIDKVHYLPQKGLNLKEWNAKVIEYISRSILLRKI